MNLGLRFVGVEIHRPYFDEACRRIEDAVSDRRNQATSESAYSGHLSAVSGRQHSRHTPASAESA
jgi:hypothetical protein